MDITEGGAWRQFKDEHPRLAMSIEVRVDGKVTDFGRIVCLRDLGGGWVGMEGVNCFASVRPEYEWRQTE